MVTSNGDNERFGEAFSFKTVQNEVPDVVTILDPQFACVTG